MGVGGGRQPYPAGPLVYKYHAACLAQSPGLAAEWARRRRLFLDEGDFTLEHGLQLIWPEWNSNLSGAVAECQALRVLLVLMGRGSWCGQRGGVAGGVGGSHCPRGASVEAFSSRQPTPVTFQYRHKRHQHLEGPQGRSVQSLLVPLGGTPPAEKVADPVVAL